MKAQAHWLAMGLLLAAAPVAAQPHGQDSGMMGMGMMGSEHGMGPAMVLMMAEPLALTPDQVRRLEAIQADRQQEHDQHMQASSAAEARAAEILSAPAPDLDAYEDALEDAADHHVAARIAMTRATLEARAVLTPDQAAKLDFGAAMMEHMMGQMGQGMGAGGMGNGMGPGAGAPGAPGGGGAGHGGH